MNQNALIRTNPIYSSCCHHIKRLSNIYRRVWSTTYRYLRRCELKNSSTWATQGKSYSRFGPTDYQSLFAHAWRYILKKRSSVYAQKTVVLMIFAGQGNKTAD